MTINRYNLKWVVYKIFKYLHYSKQNRIDLFKRAHYSEISPRIMNIFLDFFENAHFHCLHYVVNKNLHFVERLFWAVWLILSMIAMIFVVNLSLQNYFYIKPTLRVNTNYLEFQTPFPATFLCETQELSWKIEKMLEEENFTTASNGLYDIRGFVRESTFIDLFDGSKSFPQCYNMSSEDDYCRFYKKYRGNISYFSKYVRASCEEMLTSCYYNGRKFDCCQHFLPVDTVQGKCYAFNSFNAVIENRFANETDDPKFQTKSLLHKYLRFMIRYNYKDNPGNLSVELSQRMVNVWTMGNTNIPTKIYRKDHITEISEFGKETQSANIFLKVKEIFPATSVYNLDENRRGCKFWFETKDLKIFKFYSDSACEIECLRNAQIQFCGCVFHTLANQLGIEQTVCNHTGVECAFKRESEISKFLSSQCHCIINCHFFDVSFIGKYPSKSENKNNDTTGKIRLNIITRAPSIQYVRDVKQELLDFIVSIGGAITLFIGCSFLSLFQIIYYFLLKPFSTRFFVKEKPKNGRLFTKREKIRR